ncbi:fibrinogen-related molecule [Elysia marginata]|uniref:Fibrinogen-related molecule n=1 Tax=Elysia marginata TaxID=1093978 RepID=A0AAV4EF58_9GAST|nr:fibrinogen-related molecule [Elysia marginata]
MNDRNKENIYRWLDQGIEIDAEVLKQWDHRHPQKGPHKNCVLAYNGVLRTEQCHSKHYFMCEMNPGPTPCMPMKNENYNWFGRDCTYKNRCADKRSVNFDRLDGSCWNGGCEPGWFGPGCQYVSIGLDVDHWNEGYNMDWLLDMDDSTCSNQERDDFNVFLQTDTLLTWIRFVVDSNIGHRLKFSILYTHQSWDGRYNDCAGAPYSFVDERTIDIGCKTGAPVDELWIQGGDGSLKHLCSVYVSGEQRGASDS